MIEIINIVKKIIDEHGMESFINSYELDYGLYVKVCDKELTEDDLYLVSNNSDTSSSIDTYNYFRKRAFFEGMLNSDSNKAVLQKGILNKKIHSVTPYSMFFKYDNIDLFSSPELIEEHFNIISSFSQREINAQEISKKFFNKIIELKKIIGDKNIKLGKSERILLFIDVSEDLYRESYSDYVKVYGFGKDNNPVEVNGELYGLPCLGVNLNSDKPILTSSDLRKIPYQISSYDSTILSYISKIRKSLNKILNTYITECSYDIHLDKYEVIRLDKNIEIKSKKPYYDFKLLSADTIYTVESMKSHKDVLSIIEGALTYGTIGTAIYRNYSTNSEMSDYFKSCLKKINNNNILQQIIIDRDIFKHYFNGNDDVDISKSIEKILKAIYEYRCNEEGSTNVIPFQSLNRKLDTIFSVMTYISGKEKYRDMAIELDNMINKFINDKKNGEVSIDNDAEFYFMAGQIIRYLAYQSEKSSKKNDLMGNFMLQSRDKIKDHIINMYELYSHKISLYAESYVNLLYQQLMIYGLGEKEVKNKDNWYYYQAGIAGKNILFQKNDKNINNVEEDSKNE